MTAVQAPAAQETVMPPTTEECSTNFYWTAGNLEVFNLQTTLRGQVDPAAVKMHLIGVIDSLKEVVKLGGHAKPVGRQAEPAPVANAAAPTPPSNGQVPTPPPLAPSAPSGPNESACAMIEVGTSYTGGKTQLKFHVNGMEHPLSYTKEMGDMVKLLSPLGYTAAHIVVGQKYPCNCIVTWQQADKYRNVLSVRGA